MPRHEYAKPHILYRLRDQLAEAGVTVQHVEGNGQRLVIFVPDSVPKAALDAVLATHDPAAIAAEEAARQSQSEAIRAQVFAAAAGAVGKNIAVLTVAERNALIAVLLWRWGALGADLTIRPLADWAYAVTPERAP